MKGISFFKSSIDYNKLEKLWHKAVASSWLTTGPLTQQFEKYLSQHLQSPYVLAISSCTHALHLALVLAGIKKGDEVILPANTFIATLEVITYLGATPILCDIDLETLNLDANLVEKKITTKTAAIIGVPFAGHPGHVEQLSKLCRKRKISFILDNAHALETKVNNKPANFYADYSCYSFYATKNLTTAEGGAIVVKNKKTYERARRLILHGLDKRAWRRYQVKQGWQYDVSEFGFKYNLSDVQAALGVVQFETLYANLAKRGKLVSRYRKNLAAVKDIRWQSADEGCAYHLFVIWFEKKGKEKQQEVMKALAKANIGFSLHFIPLYRLTVAKKNLKLKKQDFTNNEKYFRGCLTLPLYPGLSLAEVDQISQVVAKAVK